MQNYISLKYNRISSLHFGYGLEMHTNFPWVIRSQNYIYLPNYRQNQVVDRGTTQLILMDKKGKKITGSVISPDLIHSPAV